MNRSKNQQYNYLIVKFINKSRLTFQWATDLAEKLLKIHDKEVSRRQEFNSLFEGHFLRSLFPGMTELPPAFATQAPPAFDARLPTITQEDVDFISNAFPLLAADVPQYGMEATVKFFRQMYVRCSLPFISVRLL